MLTLRKSEERGQADHGWLFARHSFSFADYFDPDHMGFRSLRVINEDRVQPGAGFPTHGHRDMEILTWILEGALEHKDSTGGGGVIRPGEMQYMSAGSGVKHSEFNASQKEPVHLLQIWIQPDIGGAPPRYGQKNFSDALGRGGWVTLASPDGRDGSIEIRQDARLQIARLDGATKLSHTLAPGRHAWLQVARGELLANGKRLKQGDALAATGEKQIELSDAKQAEVLLFDLK
ncbi:MAG: pirin family protein [Planctomycetes bacterium]|nr:pirin family protein [Planctomycetota bacterium]